MERRISSPTAGVHSSRTQGVKRHASGVAKSAKSTASRVTKRLSTSSSSSTAAGKPAVRPDVSTDSHGSQDSRHKRVWKACERCRMKKTKCDGEFPCKRCKDDGLVCTAGTRKKVEYKQLPRGYAEVLEVTQMALVATVHKLYAMVREGQKWNHGEPDLNERRQPVIHDIAQRLHCIRANADIDLPVHSVFPESATDLVQLAAQLEAQHRLEGMTTNNTEDHDLEEMDQHSESDITPDADDEDIPSVNSRASSPDLEHSDFEDYRKIAFGGMSVTVPVSDGAPAGTHHRRRGAGAGAGGDNRTLSPASLTYDSSFDSSSVMTTTPPPLPCCSSNRTDSTPSPTTTTTTTMRVPANLNSVSEWRIKERKHSSLDGGVGIGGWNTASTAQAQARTRTRTQLTQQQQQQQQRQQHQGYNNTQFTYMPPVAAPSAAAPATVKVSAPSDINFIQLLDQGLFESDFGNIKPHVSSCPSPMLGVGDPMIYSGYGAGSGYDGDVMRL